MKQHRGIAVKFYAIALLCFCILSPVGLFSQVTEHEFDDEPEFFEISVYFNVPRIGGADLPALILDDNLYLSVTDVFSFLKIRADVSPGFNYIDGFFIDEKARYRIDREQNTIEYNNRAFRLNPGDLLRTETNLYLKSNYFGEIFGLEASFNFRSLSVNLNTSVELPIIREMRLEQMRRNVGQLTGDIIADTTIAPRYPLFRLGVADWNISTSHTIDGNTNSRLALKLGSVIAGGETNVTLNYNPNTPFVHKDQYYTWRFANNDFRPLRQVTLGKTMGQSIATLNSPVIGIQLTNTPTTYRRSYGSYTISDVTEPGWTVELYVNNVLIDYQQADASGFFSFEVPLIYGNTDIRLQYYGPWGEVRSEEKSISVPFNFLPQGTFEYRITGGVLEDSTNSRFSRANFDIGATSFLTVGGGVEYLSSYREGGFIPFVNTSIRLAPTLLISGEYAHEVKFTGNLNYRLFSDIQLEMSYTKYDENQTAIFTNFLEERKASLSMPFRKNQFALFSRLTYNQFIMASSKYSSAELLLSTSYKWLNANLTTSAIYTNFNDPDIYSTLHLGIRAIRGFVFTPQLQYNYKRGEIVTLKGSVEKHLRQKGYLNFSYEHNFHTESTNIELGLRFDLSFGRFGASARRSGSNTVITGNAAGSILTDIKGKYIGTSERPSVGRGGLVLLPFLDLNGNGIRDEGEPRAYGVELRSQGGRTEYNQKDTTIRVFELEPYTNHLITLHEANFQSIAWQLTHKTMRVAIDPNQFKHIDVPISIISEAAGMVYIQRGTSQRGLGRVIVNFYRSDSSFIKSVLSEEDGYFTYFGLTPGSYYATLDNQQLQRINMQSLTEVIHFTIEQSIDGEYLDDLEFILEPLQTEPQPTTPVSTPAPDVPVTPPTPPVKQQHWDDGVNEMYTVQLAALKSHNGIYEQLLPLLLQVPGIEITETLSSDGFYRYYAGSFKESSQAAAVLKAARSTGWKDAFINKLSPEEHSKNITNHITYVPEKATFKIQLHAVTTKIDIAIHFAKLKEAIPGITIHETYGSDGLYRYSAGDFRSRAEAIRIIREIRALGWRDSFIISAVENKE